MNSSLGKWLISKQYQEYEKSVHTQLEFKAVTLQRWPRWNRSGSVRARIQQMHPKWLLLWWKAEAFREGKADGVNCRRIKENTYFLYTQWPCQICSCVRWVCMAQRGDWFCAVWIPQIFLLYLVFSQKKKTPTHHQTSPSINKGCRKAQ